MLDKLDIKQKSGLDKFPNNWSSRGSVADGSDFKASRVLAPLVKDILGKQNCLTPDRVNSHSSVAALHWGKPVKASINKAAAGMSCYWVTHVCLQ